MNNEYSYDGKKIIFSYDVNNMIVKLVNDYARWSLNLLKIMVKYD